MPTSCSDTIEGAGRRRRSLAVGLVLAVLVTLAAGCGSTPSAAPRPQRSGRPAAHETPAAATAEVVSACSQVAAALSDGPDPGADPVGYAEAQILPLHEIKTSDTALQQAIDELAAAYQRVYQSNAAKGTSAAVARAGGAVNRICPGATS